MVYSEQHPNGSAEIRAFIGKLQGDLAAKIKKLNHGLLLLGSPSDEIAVAMKRFTGDFDALIARLIGALEDAELRELQRAGGAE
jgi:hypothetical protein